MIRADHLNERYYALSNEPNLSHIKKHYHFDDHKGRLYMVAVKNKQLFKNERLAYRERQPRVVERARCVMDNSGYIKLYVGLANPSVRWFGSQDINQDLLLFPRYPPQVTNTTSIRPLLVTLKTTFKPSPTKRRGTIHVRGLTSEQCDALLNKD